MKRQYLLTLLPLVLFLFACAASPPRIDIPESATFVELSVPQCT
jgi:hypothetical protein